MRLLLVGANSKYAIERPYLQYLKANPLIDDVALFEAQNIFLSYYQKNLFNKIAYRLGYQSILKAINRDLLSKIDIFQPHALFVFKGMEIFPQTLVQIKKRGILLANYNPDNPFIFSGRGSGNANITQSIGLYDLHFTYSRAIEKTLQNRYPYIPTDYLPFGFDISEQLYQDCKKQEERIKVCFLGNPDKYRADLIKKICSSDIQIDVYGHNWANYVKHKNCTVFNPVYDADLWYTLAKYRVQLNIMRPHNLDSHNMRTFEIPAIGGIQLAPDTPEHRLFFKNGEEIFLYKEEKECMSMIKKLLTISEQEAISIRRQARDRSINDHHSYHWRSIQVASRLEKLLYE